ncbi:hypothetical protein C8J57DRAFT_1575034 [Mycena rebaudengoi]|nr:hypothetical protein C8J57DRAFT_1575034 [Mycena rebaudengoi]
MPVLAQATTSTSSTPTYPASTYPTSTYSVYAAPPPPTQHHAQQQQRLMLVIPSSTTSNATSNANANSTSFHMMPASGPANAYHAAPYTSLGIWRDVVGWGAGAAQQPERERGRVGYAYSTATSAAYSATGYGTPLREWVYCGGAGSRVGSPAQQQYATPAPMNGSAMGTTAQYARGSTTTYAPGSTPRAPPHRRHGTNTWAGRCRCGTGDGGAAGPLLLHPRVIARVIHILKLRYVIRHPRLHGVHHTINFVMQHTADFDATRPRPPPTSHNPAAEQAWRMHRLHVIPADPSTHAYRLQQQLQQPQPQYRCVGGGGGGRVVAEVLGGGAGRGVSEWGTAAAVDTPDAVRDAPGTATPVTAGTPAAAPQHQQYTPQHRPHQHQQHTTPHACMTTQWTLPQLPRFADLERWSPGWGRWFRHTPHRSPRMCRKASCTRTSPGTCSLSSPHSHDTDMH